MRYLFLIFVVIPNAFSQSKLEETYSKKDSFVNLEDIVVTATKTPKRKTNSPIIVNVTSARCNIHDLGRRVSPFAIDQSGVARGDSHLSCWQFFLFYHFETSYPSGLIQCLLFYHLT